MQAIRMDFDNKLTSNNRVNMSPNIYRAKESIETLHCLAIDKSIGNTMQGHWLTNTVRQAFPLCVVMAGVFMFHSLCTLSNDEIKCLQTWIQSTVSSPPCTANSVGLAAAAPTIAFAFREMGLEALVQSFARMLPEQVLERIFNFPVKEIIIDPILQGIVFRWFLSHVKAVVCPHNPDDADDVALPLSMHHLDFDSRIYGYSAWNITTSALVALTQSMGAVTNLAPHGVDSSPLATFWENNSRVPTPISWKGPTGIVIRTSYGVVCFLSAFSQSLCTLQPAYENQGLAGSIRLHVTQNLMQWGHSTLMTLFLWNLKASVNHCLVEQENDKVFLQHACTSP